MFFSFTNMSILTTVTNLLLFLNLFKLSLLFLLLLFLFSLCLPLLSNSFLIFLLFRLHTGLNGCNLCWKDIEFNIRKINMKQGEAQCRGETRCPWRVSISCFRDAEIFLNKQVKITHSTNNASPDNKIYTNISYFLPVWKKLCQSKQADLLFSASLLLGYRHMS